MKRSAMFIRAFFFCSNPNVLSLLIILVVKLALWFYERIQVQRVLQLVDERGLIMPRGDGTGPPGGGDRGLRRMGGPLTAGPGGNYICPRCGNKEPHISGQPCNRKTCPECDAQMTRE